MTTKGHQQQMPQTLTDLREAKGLSLVDVGQRMGVTKGRVSHIEARFPNLNYDTVARYMSAIEAQIEFVLDGIRVSADQIKPDPGKAATREYLTSRADKGGNLVYVKSAPAEELVLEQSEPRTGGDDTGGNIDEPDPEGDQSDRQDGQ